MKRSIHSIFAIIVLSSLCLFFVQCGKKQKDISGKIVLNIPDTKFMGILPLYVAEEEGFFSDEGIKVKWIDVRDPGQGAKLFFDGQADLIMTTFANLIPAEVIKPGTLKIVCPIYESAEKPGSYILVASDSSKVKTLADLKGKTLGTYTGPSQKAYAIILLRNLGLKEPDNVRLVQVSSSAQVPSLFGGSFDALFTVEPYGSTAISKGAKIIEKGVRTKYISNPFWLGAAAVSPQTAENKPRAMEGLINAFDKAIKFITQNDTKAREILARRTNTDTDVARTCALYTWVAHPSKIDLEQIQQHIDLLLSEGIIEKKVNVTQLVLGASNE